MNRQLQDPALSRPLPIAVRPYMDETTRSFIRRINAANVLHHGELMKILRRDRSPWLYSLSAWTGTELEVLMLAMPQLAGHHLEEGFWQKLVGRPNRTITARACHRCTLARDAGTSVGIYTTHERVICPKHALWIGECTAGASDQFSIGSCPQITMAWHHHQNLIVRHRHTRVRRAFEASNAINWRWQQQFLHFTLAGNIYDGLASAFPRQACSQGLVAASLYPPMVMLTSAIVSPY